jgi:hypothetical protein
MGFWFEIKPSGNHATEVQEINDRCGIFGTIMSVSVVRDATASLTNASCLDWKRLRGGKIDKQFFKNFNSF